MTPSDQTELRELFIRFGNAWTQAFNEVDPHGDDTNHYDGHKAVYRRSKEIQSGILQEAEQLIAAAEQRARIELVEQLIDAQDQETDLDNRPVGQIYHILGGDDRDYLEYVVLPRLKAELEQSLRKEQE